MKLKKPDSFKGSAEKYARRIVNSYDLKKCDFKDKWPCFECSGRGYKRESCGYYDSEVVKCYYCNNGVISKSNFLTYFEPIKKQYFSDLEEWRKTKAELMAAKKKLTRKEYVLILTYGDI